MGSALMFNDNILQAHEWLKIAILILQWRHRRRRFGQTQRNEFQLMSNISYKQSRFSIWNAFSIFTSHSSALPPHSLSLALYWFRPLCDSFILLHSPNGSIQHDVESFSPLYSDFVCVCVRIVLNVIQCNEMQCMQWYAKFCDRLHRWRMWFIFDS